MKLIYISDAYHDYSFDENMRRDHIEYEVQIQNDDNLEQFTNKNIHIITVYMYVEPYVSTNMSS